jgi:hypothetical protein
MTMSRSVYCENWLLEDRILGSLHTVKAFKSEMNEN